MNTALLDIDRPWHDLQLVQPGGGRITAVGSAGSSLIVVTDRSQSQPLPAGAKLLDAFLDEFEARPEISELLPEARQDLAEHYAGAGVPTSLRLLRLRAGLSQKEFAKAIGTSQAAISSYELRTRKPNEDAIRSMASALSVDFNTLMEALANAGA